MNRPRAGARLSTDDDPLERCCKQAEPLGRELHLDACAMNHGGDRRLRDRRGHLYCRRRRLAARERIATALHRFYSYFGVTGLEAVAVYRPPDACVRGLPQVADTRA